MPNYLTKKEFIGQFKSTYAEHLKTNFNDDRPLKWQTWNDAVDDARKSKLIDPTSDWTQPQFIQK